MEEYEDSALADDEMGLVSTRYGAEFGKKGRDAGNCSMRNKMSLTRFNIGVGMNMNMDEGDEEWENVGTAPAHLLLGSEDVHACKVTSQGPGYEMCEAADMQRDGNELANLGGLSASDEVVTARQSQSCMVYDLLPAGTPKTRREDSVSGEEPTAVPVSLHNNSVGVIEAILDYMDGRGDNGKYEVADDGTYPWISGDDAFSLKANFRMGTSRGSIECMDLNGHYSKAVPDVFAEDPYQKDVNEDTVAIINLLDWKRNRKDVRKLYGKEHCKLSITTFKNCIGVYYMVKFLLPGRPTKVQMDMFRRDISMAVANAGFFSWLGGKNANYVLPSDCQGEVSNLSLNTGTGLVPHENTLRNWLPMVQSLCCTPVRFYKVSIDGSKAGAVRVMRDQRRIEHESMNRSKKRALKKQKTTDFVPGDVPGNDKKFVSGMAPVFEGNSIEDDEGRSGGDPLLKLRQATDNIEGYAITNHGYNLTPTECGGESLGTIGIRPLEGIVKDDMRTPECYSALMQSANRLADPTSALATPMNVCRGLVMRFRGKVEGVSPTVSDWSMQKISSAYHLPAPSQGAGSCCWKWTGVLPGDYVTIVGGGSLRRSMNADCTKCSASFENRKVDSAYRFDWFEAQKVRSGGIPSQSSCSGQVRVVWKVKGCSSWDEINSECAKVLSKTAETNIRNHFRTKGSEAEPECEEVCPVYDASTDEIKLAVLLSKVAMGRTPAEQDETHQPSVIEGSSSQLAESDGHDLPWSPLKAADTVALIRLGKVCPLDCACRIGDDTQEKLGYVVFVFRYYRDRRGPSRFLFWISDIRKAISIIHSRSQPSSEPCTRRRRGRTASYGRRLDCPFGSDCTDRLCVSSVLEHPLSDSVSCASSSPLISGILFKIENDWNMGNEFGPTHRAFHIDDAVFKECRSPRKLTGIIAPGHAHAGLRYVVLTYVLSHDGFGLETGTETSRDGIYIAPLGCSNDNRISAASVRILSLTAAGSDVCEALVPILSEWAYLSTEGILCMSPAGIPIVVFPVLAGLIADTPALAKCLDTRGHRSNSMCTSCNLKFESEAGLGIRGGKGTAAMNRTEARGLEQSGVAFLSICGRSMSAHDSIRAVLRGLSAGEESEELERVGLKELPSTVNFREGDHSKDIEAANNSTFTPDYRGDGLVLHEFSRRLEHDWREGKVAVNKEDGKPVHDSVFHPYICSIPGSEHWSSNLIKAFIECNLLLMIPEERRKLNLYLGYYSECAGRPAQSDFINVPGASLHSMSMTKMALVGCIGPAALRMSIAFSGESRRKSSEYHALTKMVEMTQDMSDIVGIIWMDAKLRVEKYGEGWMEVLEGKYLLLMRKIEEACKDSPHPEYDILRSASGQNLRNQKRSRKPNSRKGRSKKNDHSRLSASEMQGLVDEGEKEKDTVSGKKDSSVAGICRRCFDKTTIHKGLELIRHFLPLQGTLYACAELVFEFIHQPLKFSMRVSLAKNPHLAAISAVSTSEWIGRLASALPAAMKGDVASTRLLLRLLRGEIAYGQAITGAGLTEEMKSDLKFLVGPDLLLPKLLRDRARSMMHGPVSGIVARCTSPDQEVWKLSFSRSGLSVAPQHLRELGYAGCGNLLSVVEVLDGVNRKDYSATMQVVLSIERQRICSSSRRNNLFSDSREGSVSGRRHNIYIGSVIRVNEALLCTNVVGSRKYSETMDAVASTKMLSTTSYIYGDTFWCVVGIYFICSAMWKKKAFMIGTNREVPDTDSSFDLVDADDHSDLTDGGNMNPPKFRLVVAPCVYADDESVAPCVGTMDYSRPLTVRMSDCFVGTRSFFGHVDSNFNFFSAHNNPNTHREAMRTVLQDGEGGAETCPGGGSTTADHLDGNSKAATVPGENGGAITQGWNGPASLAILPDPTTDTNLLEVMATLPNCVKCRGGAQCNIKRGQFKKSDYRLLEHSNSCGPLSGGSFYVLDRTSGYPPKAS